MLFHLSTVSENGVCIFTFLSKIIFSKFDTSLSLQNKLSKVYFLCFKDSFPFCSYSLSQINLVNMNFKCLNISRWNWTRLQSKSNYFTLGNIVSDFSDSLASSIQFLNSKFIITGKLFSEILVKISYLRSFNLSLSVELYYFYNSISRWMRSRVTPSTLKELSPEQLRLNFKLFGCS